jgi:hypothetical protein
MQVRSDDSYIFLVYARNLAQGNGFVFYPGEYVNGSTSALFPIVIALVSFPLSLFSSEQFFLAARLIQFLSLVALCFFTARLLFRSGARSGATLFPILFLSSSLTVSGVGMETFLVLALAAAVIDLYCREAFDAAAFCMGLLVLARPDGILLALPLGAHFVVTRRRLPSLRHVGIFCAVVLPWAAFSTWYFGSPVPGTLEAKIAQSGTGRWGQGLLYLKGGEAVLESHYAWAGVLTLLSLLTIFLRRKKLQTAPVCFLLSWMSAHFLVYAFILNPPAYPWYYSPFAFPIAFVVSLALGGFNADIQGRRLARFAIVALVGVAGLVIAFASLRSDLRLRPTAKYELYRRAAVWLNANAADGSSVANNEVGVLGYFYSRGKVIDPLGLVTKGAVDHLRRQEYHWYIDEHAPDFIVFRQPLRPILEDFAREPWFLARYSLATIVRTKFSAASIYRRTAESK